MKRLGRGFGPCFGAKKTFIISVSFFVGCLGGCATVAINGTKAYVDDHMRTNLDADFRGVWQAAFDQCGTLGEVRSSDKDKGILRALVKESDVIINIEPVTDRTTRITVTARKHLLPDKETAEIVLSAILRTL